MPLRTRRRGHESDRQKWGVWSPRRVVLGHFYRWGKGGNGQKMRRRERVCANEAVCPCAASSVWTRGANKEGANKEGANKGVHSCSLTTPRPPTHWWCHSLILLVRDKPPFGTRMSSCRCCCCSGRSGDGSLPMYREQSRWWSESRRVVIKEVIDWARANHWNELDDYITIWDHVLGAKSQKLPNDRTVRLRTFFGHIVCSIPSRRNILC